MVIAGAAEPSPERAAAWSAVVATPHSGPEKVTTATKPPLPQAPKPVSAVSETILPLAPAAPLAAPESGPSAPVAVPSGLAAPPAPPPAAVEPSVPAPGPDPAPPASSAPVVAQSPPGVPAALPAAVVLPAAIPAVAQSLLAVFATTGGPAPLVAPSAAGQSAPAVAPMALAGQPSRPQSPDRRPSRPHSPAPHQDRRSSRRRRDSPRRYQQQPHWPAHPGGQGDWRGSRGRGGGGGYRPPVTMADLQREVSRAVREERASQSQSSSMRASPALEAPRQPVLPLSPPPVAAPPPQVHIPTASAPAASAPAPGARLRLPPVPPVAGVAADQLAVLLAPVLAAPAEGGAAAAGQLDEAVRGLRRHLRAGSGAAAIGASTLVVRELWRSLTGILHALGAHRMQARAPVAPWSLYLSRQT
ncbi:unnamed protein product [Closterium sp. Naga37s-1]|nr:unnamed protein product [Closterium sp. Naga37s-1]